MSRPPVNSFDAVTQKEICNTCAALECWQGRRAFLWCLTVEKTMNQPVF